MLSFSKSIKPVNIYSLTYVCCLNNAFNYKKEDIPCKWTQVRQISEWGDIIAITVTPEQVGYILSYNLYSWLIPLSCTYFFFHSNINMDVIFKLSIIDINWFVDFACLNSQAIILVRLHCLGVVLQGSSLQDDFQTM